MRIRYCFIEDQDCTKLTKGKTPDILMSLYESYLTKCCPTLRIHTIRIEINLTKLLTAISMYPVS